MRQLSDTHDLLGIDQASIVRFKIGHGIIHSDGIGVRMSDHDTKLVMKRWQEMGMTFEYIRDL